MIIKPNIGIDFGTCNTLIYEKKKGIVLNEPSIIAIDKKTEKIIDIGQSLYNKIGKQPKNIELIYPLKNGKINDVNALELLITEFIKKIRYNVKFIKPSILISCPSTFTKLEIDIIKDILIKLGAKNVIDESSIKLSALGAGLNISEPKANMIIDIGATTTDIVIFSLGELVASTTVKIGGFILDEKIKKLVKEKYKLLIGNITAENIKIINVDLSNQENIKMEVKGKDLISGLPKTVTINLIEISSIIREDIKKITKEIITLLSTIQPELSTDIAEKGIVITGGTSKIKGLLDVIREEIKIPVFITECPLLSTIEGHEYLINQQKIIDKDL